MLHMLLQEVSFLCDFKRILKAQLSMWINYQTRDLMQIKHTGEPQRSPALWWRSAGTTRTIPPCAKTPPLTLTPFRWISGGWTAKILMSAMCEKSLLHFLKLEASGTWRDGVIGDALSPTHLELISKSKTNTHKHTYKATDAHSQTLLQRAPQVNPSQLLNFRHDRVNTLVCPRTRTHVTRLCGTLKGHYYYSTIMVPAQKHIPLTKYRKRNNHV